MLRLLADENFNGDIVRALLPDARKAMSVTITVDEVTSHDHHP